LILIIIVIIIKLLNHFLDITNKWVVHFVIPIYLYLNKISKRQQLRMASLPTNYTLNFLLENQHSKKTKFHWLSLEYLTSKQWQRLKSPIVNSNNHLNGLFSFFNNLHKELSSGFQLVNNFPDHFFFYIVDYKKKKSRMLIYIILKSLKKYIFLDENRYILIW